jgi:hypothetical protein
MQSFADTFYTSKNVPEAFNNYVATNYIKLSVGILSDQQNAINALQRLFSSLDNTFDVERLTVSQDLANEKW